MTCHLIVRDNDAFTLPQNQQWAYYGLMGIQITG